MNRLRYRRRSTDYLSPTVRKHASVIQYVLCHLSRLAATTYIAGDPLLSFTLIVNDESHPFIGVSIYIRHRISSLCGRSCYYLMSLASAIRRHMVPCQRMESNHNLFTLMTDTYREWTHPTPQGIVRKHIPPFTFYIR